MFATQVFMMVLAFSAVGIQASPLSPRAVPTITNPRVNSVWPIGTVQTVAWDTSNFPPDSQITDPIGQVMLGLSESPSFLNLDILQYPLAQNFMLRDGSVKVTVPNVLPRTDYRIVLAESSSNASVQFASTTISTQKSGCSNQVTLSY